jgi:hypothetical protein
VDFDSWLSHVQQVVQLQLEHSRIHREAEALQGRLEAHEREQDTFAVTSVQSMDDHASTAWALSQTLNALMSAQKEPSVEQRDPQPSQSHLIAREQDARNQGAGNAGQFTPAPAQVHPLLRQLLQQPYGHGAGQRTNFIQIEPELQRSALLFPCNNSE